MILSILRWTLALAILVSTVTKAELPNPKDEYVNDFAQVISIDSRLLLRQQLQKVEQSSGVEIVVATITSYQRYGQFSSWEDFSTALFNKWRIGNRSMNNGVLLLISEEDRKVRIELGSEYPAHYNKIMKDIIDEKLIPDLKIGNYDAAISKGTAAIIDATTEKVSFVKYYQWQILGGVVVLISLIAAFYAKAKGKKGFFWTLLGLAGLIFVWIVASILTDKRSEGHGGGSSQGGGASGSF